MSDTTTSTEIEVSSNDELANSLAALRRGESAGIVTWLTMKTEDDALAAFDAVTNSVPLADNRDKRLNIVNAIIQSVELVNESTGGIEAQPRVTLIDDKGVAYHVTSNIAYRSLRTLFAFVGTPERWTKPMPLMAVQGGTGSRKFIEIKRAK